MSAAVEFVQQAAPKPGLLHRVAARTRGLWFAHSSGRFDRPSNLWRAALTYLRRKAVLVTGTEAAGRDKALFRAALAGTDWSYAHLSGAAEGEAYATWDGGVLETFTKPFAHKLTDKTWTRSKEYGGKQAAKVHALVLPMRVIATGKLYWIAVVHMPLDNTPARAEAWVDCCRGLVDLQAELHRRDPKAEFIPVGDWNKNLRKRDEFTEVYAHLRKPLDLVTSWSGTKELRSGKGGGTHGDQLIDYALLRRQNLAGCELLRDLPDSDHRAFRYRIKEKP